ncbi:MAG: hypothetical protein CM15mP117_16330 [Alphaproteobacteria bacterium]|nr:MAG: hypothetical protein CM15mP117_16330 [Alphaproteobacteria bacterium]
MSEHEKNIGFLWPCDGLNEVNIGNFCLKMSGGLPQVWR